MAKGDLSIINKPHLKISKFNGRNWQAFSSEIERLLRAEDLWEPVEYIPGLKDVSDVDDKKNTTQFALHLATRIKELDAKQRTKRACWLMRVSNGGREKVIPDADVYKSLTAEGKREHKDTAGAEPANTDLVHRKIIIEADDDEFDITKLKKKRTVKSNDPWYYHEDNAKALSIFTSYIEPDIRGKLGHIHSVCDLFLLLKERYGVRSHLEQWNSLVSLFTTTVANSGNTISSYISKLETIHNELAESNLRMPEEILIFCILFTLPPEYKDFRDRKRDQGVLNLSVIDVMNDLRNEERLKNHDATAESQGFFGSSKGGKGRGKGRGNKDGSSRASFTCEYCKKFGHKEAKCWIKDPNLAPEDRREEFKQKSKEHKNPPPAPINFEGYVSALSESAERTASVFATPSARPQVWYYDTCAASHVCNDRTLFSRLYPTRTSVGGVTATSRASWKGTVTVEITRGKTVCTVTLNDVIYMPQCPVNLISACRLLRLTKFDFTLSAMAIKHGPHVIGDLSPEGDLLRIERTIARVPPNGQTIVAFTDEPAAAEVYYAASLETWHRRFGHLSYATIKKLSRTSNGVVITSYDEPACEACARVKLRTKPFGERTRAERPGQVAHTDIVGVTPQGIRGENGYVSFIDDYLRYSDVDTYQHRSEIPQKLISYDLKTQRRYNTAGLDRVISDGGGEYVKAADEMKKLGVTWVPTVHHTPQENGLAEVVQFLLDQMATALLSQMNLPEFLWPYALRWANYIRNRTPKKSLGDVSPYEKAFGKPPDLRNLATFGCVVYYLVTKEYRVQSRKFNERGRRGRLIGVEGASGIYTIWIEGTRKIVRERNVQIMEDSEPYNGRQYQDSTSEEPAEGAPEELYRDSTSAEAADMAEAAEPSAVPTYQRQRITPYVINSNYNNLRDDLTPENEPEVPPATDIVVPVRPPTPPGNQAPDSEILGGNNDENGQENRPTELDEAQSVGEREYARPEASPDVEENDTIIVTSRGGRINVTPAPSSRDQDSAEHSGHSAQDTTPAQPPRRSVRNAKPPQRYDDLKYDSKGRPISSESANSALHFTALYEALQAYDIEDEFFRPEEEYLALAATLANPSADSQADEILEPTSYRDTITGPHAKQWQKSMEAEVASQREGGTWKLVPRTGDMNVLKGRWVYKVKLGPKGEVLRYKSRYVIKGYLQKYGIDYLDTWAGVVNITVIRIILAIAAVHDLEIDQVDGVTSFLNPSINEEIYMEQIEGFEEGEQDSRGRYRLVCRILKGLYGLKQAANAWFKMFVGVMEKLGFRQLTSDTSVFIAGKSVVTGCTVTAHVDDFKIITKHREYADKVKRGMAYYFDIVDCGPISYYLGMEVIRDRQQRSITLTQRGYIKKILRRYQFHEQARKPTKTPLKPGHYPSPSDELPNDEIRAQYQSLAGSEMYAATQTRIDIAHAVSTIAQFMHNPSSEHLSNARRILKYLDGTAGYGITYGGPEYSEESSAVPMGYSDANHGGDKHTGKSTSGNVFMLFGGPISWTSRRQETVALSTTEAEYIALCQAVREAAWLRIILSELGIAPKEDYAVPIACDSTGAIATGKANEFHKRAKHINIIYHYVRQEVIAGRVSTPYIQSKENLADGLTKPLDIASFLRFTNQTGLHTVA